MKQFACFLALLSSSILYAQTPSPAQLKEKDERSKIEAFSLKTGSLIKKEFRSIGMSKKVEVKALTITDILSNVTINGVKLETEISKSYGSVSKSAFLDADEIDAFIKSSKHLTESIGTPGDYYTEFQFTSRDGFQAGCYSDKKDGWKYFLKLVKYDNDSYVFLTNEDFQKLIDLVEKCKPGKSSISDAIKR